MEKKITFQSAECVVAASLIFGARDKVEQGKRRIPIHYGSAELAEDLWAVDALAGQ